MSRLAALAACLLLAACAARQDGPSTESSSIVGEVGDPRNRARIHTELAAVYYERGNMGIALEELRAATAADASYAQAHGMFGLVYMELREKGLAEASFERAVRLSPNDPDINHNFGWFLCQSGREQDSIRYFLHALRNPLYQMPWRSYSAAGVCSLRSNNAKDAEEFFTRALKLEPDEPSALLQLGQIRYRQGNIDDARKLGERVAEQSYANQLRRRFPASREYQSLQRGEYD